MTLLENYATGTAGVVDTGGKLPPVSTTLAVNLSPVSRQIIEPISDCLHLKVNLKEKMHLYVNSTTQRCPKK